MPTQTMNAMQTIAIQPREIAPSHPALALPDRSLPSQFGVQNRAVVPALWSPLDTVAVGQSEHKESLLNGVLWLRLSMGTIRNASQICSFSNRSAVERPCSQRRRTRVACPLPRWPPRTLPPLAWGWTGSVECFLGVGPARSWPSQFRARGILPLDELNWLAVSGEFEGHPVSASRLAVQKELLTPSKALRGAPTGFR